MEAKMECRGVDEQSQFNIIEATCYLPKAVDLALRYGLGNVRYPAYGPQSTFTTVDYCVLGHIAVVIAE